MQINTHTKRAQRILVFFGFRSSLPRSCLLLTKCCFFLILFVLLSPTLSFERSQESLITSLFLCLHRCEGVKCLIFYSMLYFLINSWRSSSFSRTNYRFFMRCQLSAFLSLKNSLTLNLSLRIGCLKPDRAPGYLGGYEDY